MHFPLNISKITPPRFPHVLHRPRLIDLLQQHCDKKLILILGPAAQGKSTLAVSWVNASKTPSAWINLGSEDADPVSLFYVLVRSLEQALADLDFSSLLAYPAMVMGPREEIPLYRDWAQSLFALVSQPIWIILDGLEQVPPVAPTNRFLQVLLDEAPPEVHFLILSRELPPLKLEVLKMRQEAFTLTGEELAFSLEETGEFLQARRLSLPARAVKLIHRLTEGWAGGLVLFCEGLVRLPQIDRGEYLLEDQTEKFKGDVFKYFGEQVFAALPPETQEFLIKSTILEVVDPDFIKDFLGVEQTRQILDDLAQRNLFVQPLYDKKRGWLYRYHLLFREFLCAKFKTLGAESQRAAYLRAGELSDQRGEPDAAVKYYLQVGAFSQAVAAIERAGPQLLKLAKTGELAGWLGRLPEALVQERPWLLFFQYITDRSTGSMEFFPNLLRAYGLFQEQQDLRGLLLTSAHLLDVSLFRSNPALTLEIQISRAEELLQRANSRAFPLESALLWFSLCWAKAVGFDPRQGYLASRNAYLLAKTAGERRLEIDALIRCHLILSNVGDFAAAEEICQQVDALLANWIFPEQHAMHLMCTGELRMFQGDLEEADRLVKAAQEIIEKHGLTFMYPAIQLYRLMSAIYLGRFAEAEVVGLNSLNFSIQTMSVFLSGVTSLFLAILNYHKADFREAKKYEEQGRQFLCSEGSRFDFHLSMSKIAAALISYHLQEFGSINEEELQEALHYCVNASIYLFLPDAHWALALWRWRQGKHGVAAEHIKAGMEIAARRGSYFSIILSPRDRGRIFTLALELEVEEVWNCLPPLLVPLADLVGPDLEQLSHHRSPKVAAQAWEIRRFIHQTRLPRLRIQTLGGFRVWRGDHLMVEKDWEGNQPRLLMKAILAHGAQGAVKDVLLEDLWPEADPEDAEKNFKVNLHRLRKALEPDLDKTFGSAFVHLKANLVSLDPDLCDLDGEKFLALVKEGEKSEAQARIKEAIAFYKEAVESYGGDFLPEELYFSWAEAKRAELKGKYSKILHRLAELHERQGTLTQAIDCYNKAVNADPLDETAYQRLMLLYAQKGRRSTALKVYQDCRQALKKELNAEPDEVTTAIYQKILAHP